MSYKVGDWIIVKEYASNMIYSNKDVIGCVIRTEEGYPLLEYVVLFHDCAMYGGCKFMTHESRVEPYKVDIEDVKNGKYKLYQSDWNYELGRAAFKKYDNIREENGTILIDVHSGDKYVTCDISSNKFKTMYVFMNDTDKKNSFIDQIGYAC